MSSVSEFMLKLFSKYSFCRGKERKDIPFDFWDVVIITSSDEEQKKAYELQIANKIHNKELPELTYYVVADAPGVKIGSGGSTFGVLSFLKCHYGVTISSLRVLLIHAGGYSQRLPSHSLCGKLFSFLPIKDDIPWQLLDLKLALFLPFLSKIPAGIFVTASDDIVTYLLEGQDWSFRKQGITALAHPSSLSVGSTHGVYVLDEETELSCWLGNCRRVLQKPSLQLMKDTSAIRLARDGTEYVYSDSSFFLSASVTEKLLDTYPSLNPLTCETDVYGDFLQPLGTDSVDTFLTTNNACPELIRVRKALYKLLQGTPLNILVLEKSRFYHLGTILELVFNWTQNADLATELNVHKRAFSVLCPAAESTKVKGVLLHSAVHSDSVIGAECILEQCQFSVPIICQSAVLYGCHLTKYSDSLVIPEKVLFFTCSVKVEQEPKWVCGAVHFEDDVKQSFDSSQCSDVAFMRKQLNLISVLFGVQTSLDFFPADCKNYSLWNVQIFPVCDSMEQAFLSTIEIVSGVMDGQKKWGEDIEASQKLSMADFMEMKCTEKMISFREQLRADISRQKNSS